MVCLSSGGSPDESHALVLLNLPVQSRAMCSELADYQIQLVTSVDSGTLDLLMSHQVQRSHTCLDHFLYLTSASPSNDLIVSIPPHTAW